MTYLAFLVLLAFAFGLTAGLMVAASVVCRRQRDRVGAWIFALVALVLAGAASDLAGFASC